MNRREPFRFLILSMCIMHWYSFAMEKEITTQDIFLYEATFKTVHTDKDLYYFCVLENGLYSYPKLRRRGEPSVQQSLYQKTFKHYFKINQIIAMKQEKLDLFNAYHVPRADYVFAEAQATFQRYAIDQLRHNNQQILPLIHNPRLDDNPPTNTIHFPPYS